MEITSTTTILELLNNGLIGKRTFNGLRIIGIEDVNSLLKYLSEGNDLLKLRNFGKKCKYEIDNVLEFLNPNDDLSPEEIKDEKFEKLDIFEKTCFVKALLNVQETENEKVRNYIRERYSKPNLLYYELFYEYEKILEIIPSFSIEENILFRKYPVSVLTKFIYELSGLLKRSYMLDVVKAKNILFFLKEHLTKFSCKDIYTFFLSDLSREYLKNLCESTYEKDLSNKALKFKNKYLGSFEELVKHFDSPSLNEYKRDLKHKHDDLIDEICIVNQKLKYILFEAAMKGDEFLRLNSIKEAHPFLSDEQAKFVLNYKTENNDEPYFFLLLNYMKASEEKEDVCYCLKHGIYDNVRRSCAEVAEKINYTPTRIMQILHSNFIAKKFIDSSNNKFLNYNVLNKPYIYSSDAKIANIIEKEKLDCNFTVFAALVKLISDYSIHFLNDNDCFLVKNDLYKSSNLKEILTKLKQYCTDKYKEDTTINIKDVIGEIPMQYEQDILDIIAYVISSTYEDVSISNGNLIMKQNTVNVEFEIYKILNEHGKPLHKEEIFKLFKQKNPNHKFTKVEQIRNALLHSTRIRPIGMTGEYGLAQWNNVFYGSIRDLIFSVLDKYDNPLTISDILEEVIKYYPNTNARSMSSSIEMDTSGRFVMFKKGFIGLSNKSYSTKYKTNIIIPRCNQSFSERLKDYCSFIETNKRFPCFSSDSHEMSLKKWEKNIEEEVIVLSDEEFRAFKEKKEKYMSLNLPKNYIEKEFRKICRDYKNFVLENNEIPTYKTNKTLYRWFTKWKNSLSIFDGTRYLDMMNLINFLKEHGFE